MNALQITGYRELFFALLCSRLMGAVFPKIALKKPSEFLLLTSVKSLTKWDFRRN